LIDIITIPDFIGHISYIIILAGTMFLHQKNKIGWGLRLIGDIGWVGVGFATGLTSAILWSSVFAVMEIRGYLSWRKEEKCQ